MIASFAVRALGELTMATEVLTAEPTTDDLRHQMQDTRTHMSDQMHALEDKALDFAHDATAVVEETIQDAKELVQATVHSAQDAARDAVAYVGHVLDFRGHIRRHPWLLVCAAFFLGATAGRLFARR
jgi:hypothetical protein